MKWLFASLLMLLSTSITPVASADELYPVVVFETSKGIIKVELDRPRAPLTVANFLRYVTNKEYDNTLFHRVIADFVVQGGGLDLQKGALPTHGNVVNESGNGLRNQRMTIAMARENPPHSASSQFYFNLADNSSLDPQSSRWGYAVFGRVIEGEEVLDTIAQVKTDMDPDLGWPDVPVEPVIVKRAYVFVSKLP